MSSGKILVNGVVVGEVTSVSAMKNIDLSKAITLEPTQDYCLGVTRTVHIPEESHVMKTYTEFENTLTPEQKARAAELFNAHFDSDDSIVCEPSTLASDADHFKEIPMSAEALAWLKEDLEKDE